ncbi:MAG: DUF4435 domain-containing protein [Cyanobacteria bacterium SBLK]|nr:DUF4435 domain-containing protein [Cyanobacteria bacterium SBLK]
MAKFDPVSYRLYLKNSIISGKNRHILVEGKDDKYLIERLWEDFKTYKNCDRNIKIIVDSAENLIQGDESVSLPENIEKVKFIANSINGKEYSDRFIGFVDRELNNFEWNYEEHAELRDRIESHQIIQRLILSRGHSIENYVFELPIIDEVLEYISTTAYANQAIKLFRQSFPMTLRIACSLGLAAAKAEALSRSRNTIDRNLIEIVSSTEPQIVFKFDEWLEKLVRRNITATQAQDLRKHYNIYNEKVANASFPLVRWICHGHISYDCLRALYEKCIVEICPIEQDRDKELSGISWIAKDKLLYNFINAWIKRSLQRQCDYPLAIFELLGVN